MAVYQWVWKFCTFFLPVLPDTRMHTSGLGRLAEPLRPKQGYASPFSLSGEL